MVIEGDGKYQGNNNEACQDRFITSANQQQPNEADHQDDELGCQNVCQDRSDEKSFFTLE